MGSAHAYGNMATPSALHAGPVKPLGRVRLISFVSD
jgi:hypothetical protein